jgi:hypothetical protein
MKFVTGTGETSEPHALETMENPEMCKAHFNALG